MPDGFDYTIAELFVVHRYRGAGAAQQAVATVLRRYPGRGHLRAIRGNARAIAFWRRTLPALGVRELSEAQDAGEMVWTFRPELAEMSQEVSALVFRNLNRTAR